MAQVNWRGDAVYRQAMTAAENALIDFGLVVEGAAKRELYYGHGRLTGTLRRSIHTATPGYAWRNDNPRRVPIKGKRVAKASKVDTKTPELGGRAARPANRSGRLTLQVGSGVQYAIWIEIGHGKFKGYHFMRNGYNKSIGKLPAVIRKYKIRGTP